MVLLYIIIIAIRFSHKKRSVSVSRELCTMSVAGRLNDRNMKGYRYDVDVDYYIYTSLNYLCALMDIRFDIHPIFILRP